MACFYWTPPRRIRRQAVSAMRVAAQRLASVRGREGMSPSISPGLPCSSPGASSISQHFWCKDRVWSMFSSILIGLQFELFFPPKKCLPPRNSRMHGERRTRQQPNQDSDLICLQSNETGWALYTLKQRERNKALLCIFSFRELQRNNFQMELRPRSAEDERTRHRLIC